MKIIETDLPEVRLIQPRVFGDDRGWFMESWQEARYQALGITGPFVQDNQALSAKGVLRGLHAQNPHPQGKLVQVLQGEVFDVAVDIRKGSPRFGQWAGALLSGDNHHQFWIPPGFAHGYCVLSDEALFSYKCTDYYHPDGEFSVRWDDPAIGIQWPLTAPPVLSDKDRNAPLLKDIPDERLLAFHP